MLDKNKDGFISPDEFLGRKPLFDIDLDHDGKVSLKEYVTVQNQKGEEVAAKSSAPAAGSSMPGNK
jgi:Ca2+-binding EF-hand superfamily protein